MIYPSAWRSSRGSNGPERLPWTSLTQGLAFDLDLPVFHGILPAGLASTGLPTGWSPGRPWFTRDGAGLTTAHTHRQQEKVETHIKQESTPQPPDCQVTTECQLSIKNRNNNKIIQRLPAIQTGVVCWKRTSALRRDLSSGSAPLQ